MAWASRAEIPKNSASNPAASGHKPSGTGVGLAHRIRIGIKQLRQIPTPIAPETPPPRRYRRPPNPTTPPPNPPHQETDTPSPPPRSARPPAPARPPRAARRRRPAQQLTQVGGQLVGGRVVEGQGERQIQLGNGLEPIKQLGGLDRVEPQVLEREPGVDVVRAGMAQHRCRLRAHLRHQHVMVLLAKRAKSLGQSRVGHGARTRVVSGLSAAPARGSARRCG